MLRKIDCVMIRVQDVEAAAAYYTKVFGLRPQWSGDDSIGLKFLETDAEIVLHNDPNIPSSVEVHYLLHHSRIKLSTTRLPCVIAQWLLFFDCVA